MNAEGSHCRMRFSRSIFLRFIAVVCFLGFLVDRSRSATASSFPSAAVEADVWTEPARELAEKIVALTGPGAALSLTLKNSSSLGAGEVAEVRRALGAELRRQGARLSNSEQALGRVRVTLSENLQGFVWVAEVIPAKEGAGAPEVVMIAVARPASAETPPHPTNLLIRKTKVWEQDEPILDLALADTSGNAAPVLLVLDPFKVSLLRMQNSTWALTESAPLAHPGPWPRDPRGRLALRPDRSFEAYVPGMKCEGKTQPALSVDCHESDEAWPLEAQGAGAGGGLVGAAFVRGRNFFDGASTSNPGEGMKAPPFFSAASVPGRSNGLRMFTGLDGRARWLDKTSPPVALSEGWGSDIAGVKTSCGSGGQVLASAPRDYTERDTLRAFEIVNREAVAVSPAVDFPGPITALWPADAGGSAVAVSRNLEAGRYEAFNLSISCGQ